MTELTSLCVFCGSRTGVNKAFATTAETIADELARKNIRLVYGCGGIGLMGVIAKRVMEQGGEVTGVIPDFLQKLEEPFDNITEKIVTGSMHERKQIMFERSDAFLVLPGGIGTLDETFEMMTWRQLGQHRKPIGLLNVDGYWDPFVQLVDHIVDEEFAESDIRENLVVLDKADDALPALSNAFKGLNGHASEGHMSKDQDQSRSAQKL